MRRKRKVRELFKEVAPGMEMEVGVDEVSLLHGKRRRSVLRESYMVDMY
jgi:hypothetical protein